MKPSRFERQQSPMLRRIQFDPDRPPAYLFLRVAAVWFALLAILVFILSLGD